MSTYMLLGMEGRASYLIDKVLNHVGSIPIPKLPRFFPRGKFPQANLAITEGDISV